MQPETLKQWLALFESGDMSGLDTILAEDAIFMSPVVHTPQEGKRITAKYLSTAHKVLGNDSFTYTNLWWNETSAVLEFEVTVDGIAINGIDMITWNAEGRIDSFKVMIRPLKAINLVHGLMRDALMAAA
ncbi:nuclear transport factor 2 family protein [Zavarzinia compransoris]|uniref:nuclear transport factor 2 family protein n=1 Tax=Zavarzinia marina TaxID=2911065 RepID=UPI001F1FE950|nr:nuclear transport factor 2 family protein [Zavarzinia marina]MCF4164901.1 nuclear transport factor 2 family protein [Zavarzinia marina]